MLEYADLMYILLLSISISPLNVRHVYNDAFLQPDAPVSSPAVWKTHILGHILGRTGSVAGLAFFGRRRLAVCPGGAANP